PAAGRGCVGTRQCDLLTNDWSEVGIDNKHECFQRIPLMIAGLIHFDSFRIVDRAADRGRKLGLNVSGSEVRGEVEVRHRVEASIMAEAEAANLLALRYAKFRTIQIDRRNRKSEFSHLLVHVAQVRSLQ